jgi:hypothetical protein
MKAKERDTMKISKFFSGMATRKTRRALWHTALTVAFLTTTSAANAAVYTYTKPPMPDNTQYSVSAGGQSIAVTTFELYDGAGNYAPKPVAGFGFDGSVNVSVTANYSFSNYKIHPTQYGISSSRSGNTVSFTLSDNTKGKIVVEFDNDYNKSLFLFADPPKPSVPSGARYIAPGYHKGHIYVGSNETVYLDAGAIVEGDINMHDVSNARVIGRGWYLGSLWVERTSNCEVSGVHGGMLGKWTVNIKDSSYFTINHLKLLYLGNETDGISFNGSGNCTAKNSFIMNYDDVFTSQRPGCKDNLTENIVVWSTGGGNIFGPGGTEDIGGNNVYRNIYIVRGKNNFLTHHWSSGPKNIAGYTFENVYADSRVPFSSFIYINNVTNVGNRYYTLRNVYVPSAPSTVNASGSCNFTFDNLVMGGTKITSTSQMNLSSTGSHTYNFASGNLVSNPSFDAENYNTNTPSGWSEGGGNAAASYTEDYGGSKSGARHATHWSSYAYTVLTFQKKTGLANGLYTLRAWAKSSGGQKTCYMEAKNFGSTSRTVNIPVSSTYQLIEIKDINVTNGQCTIGFWSDANAGNWCYFDDVEFFKQ